MCLNTKTLEVVDVSKNYPELYKGRIIDAKILTKNDPDLMIFAFVSGDNIEYENNEKNKCSDMVASYTEQKCQQLRLLEFHPIKVNFTIFNILWY